MKPLYTVGIDVGSNFIKLVLMDYSGEHKILDKSTEKIRKRDPSLVAEDLQEYLHWNWGNIMYLLIRLHPD